MNRYGRAVGWIEPDWPDPPLRKLFVLPPGEVRPPRSGPPLLQVLVKESFVPREFHPGDDPGPHADATVAPDGTTSVSDVGACHDCHSTRESRLFGVGTRPG